MKHDRTPSSRDDAPKPPRTVDALAREVGLRLDTFDARASRSIIVANLQKKLGMPSNADMRRAIALALMTRTHWLDCGSLIVLSRRAAQGTTKARQAPHNAPR